MKNAVSNVFEMILGAIVFTLGMMFLLSNERTLYEFTGIVNATNTQSEDLYEQNNDTDLFLTSDEELHAIVIGYREYPITIDGTVIEKDGDEYEQYITLIKDGYYRKSYDYDTTHNISSVRYTYQGLLQNIYTLKRKIDKIPFEVSFVLQQPLFLMA